ncbi:MAG: zinc metalloprotease HtpX [Patescibacteria group bacterium]
MSSVYTIQRNNRTRTTIIIMAFIALTTLVGYTASLYFRSYGFALFAFGLSLVQSLIAYYVGDKVALAISQAQEIKYEDSPQIFEMVQNLSKIAGIPTPRVYISPDRSANAFACGRDPEHASICLNQGILDLLNKNELEGVIAHELSHVANRDTLVMTVTMVLASVISFLVDIMFRISFFGFGGDDEDRNIQPWVFVLWIALVILAPVLAMLMQLAVSRSREYLADATAVSYTRYPEGLISALQKLYSQRRPADIQASSMNSLYISPARQRGAANFFSNLLSTHPSIEDRIANLKGEK